MKPLQTLLLVVLVLSSAVPIVQADPTDTVYQFGLMDAYEGHRKARLMVASAEILYEGCNWEAKSFADEFGLNFDATQCENDVQVKVKVEPEYTGFIPSENDDLSSRLPKTPGCVESDTKVECSLPYSFYTWVSDNDYINLERWNKYGDEDLLSSNSPAGGTYSPKEVNGRDITEYYRDKHSLSSNFKMYSTRDIEFLTALDSGLRDGSFGTSVCNSQVRRSNNNEATYYENPVLNDETFCNDDSRASDSELFVTQGNFYNARVNYYEFPFEIDDVTVTCRYTNSGDRVLTVSKWNMKNVIPSLRSFETVEESNYYKKGGLGGRSAESAATALDTIVTCPSSGGKSPEEVEVGFKIRYNTDYRHLSPVDDTAYWSDIFSSSVFPGGMNNQNSFVINAVWDGLSVDINSTSGDNYPTTNSSANESSSFSEVDDSGSQTVGGSQTDSSTNPSENSDTVGNMISIARQKALVDGEESFFDRLFDVAMFLFGAFLLVYTIVAVVLFSAFAFLLMFGIYRGTINAIDEIFDAVERRL